ncbi:MAG: rane protein, partial [Firmicutes bacterium]|nr:rane protein [Bacillota bacterium]
LAGKVAEPLKSIDKLTVVDTGNGEGAARVSNYVTSLMATAPEMVKSVTGLDFVELAQKLTSKDATGLSDRAKTSSEVKTE